MRRNYIILIALLSVLILGVGSYFAVKLMSTPKNPVQNNVPIANTQEYLVIDEQARLWSEANENSQVLSTLKIGDILEVGDKTKYTVKLRGIEEYWYNAKINNVQGWIHGQYISKKEELNQKIMQTYIKKNSQLPNNEADSISKSLSVVKAYMNIKKDNNINDELYRNFFDLYSKVIDNSQLSEQEFAYLTKYGENGDKRTIDQEDLSEYPKIKSRIDNLITNGFRFMYPEGMPQIDLDYKFLLNNFSEFVSDGIREYLTIQKNEQMIVPVIEDAALAVTWDELAARIIIWENYIKKYPTLKEVQQAKSEIDFYLQIYTGRIGLDNTPVFDYDTKKLQDNLRQSYERFLTNYPNSKYYLLIKGYYDILKKNNFEFNESADNYLTQNGIKKLQ